MDELLEKIKTKYPFVEIEAYESKNKIELMKIWLPPKNRNSGVGTDIIRMIQKYAADVNKPIVLRPEAEKGRKKDLENFYKKLQFIPNRGRNIDYALSSPTSSTMYWKFKEWLEK